MYTIKYYRTANGKELASECLNGLNLKARAAFRKRQGLLEKGLLPFKWPYVGYLRDKIYEFRVEIERNTYRILFFFVFKNYMLFTHAFMKKTDKVPDNEIERVLRYKADFENRYKKGEYEL